MKSDKTNKLVVILALVILTAVLLLLAASSWGIIKLSNFVGFLEDGPAFARVLVGILFLALAAGAVFAIYCAASIGKGLKRSEMNLLRQNQGGASYISSDAVTGMVQRLLKKNRQIKSSDCKVVPVEDGITVEIKMTAFEGGDLNALCAAIQNDVKYEIENATGIPVRGVAVNIVKTIEGAQTETVEVSKRVN